MRGWQNVRYSNFGTLEKSGFGQHPYLPDNRRVGE